MHILLVRHGETELNVARVIQPPDTALNARGIAQAQAISGRLASMGVRGIVSSDHPRALLTAQIVAGATGAPLATTELLRERDFGDWRGRKYSDLPADPLTSVDAPPGGESLAEFEQRIALAFSDVLRRQTLCGGNLVVVTHGLVIRSILTHHTQLPGGASVPQHLGNTCLSIIETIDPYAVLDLNSTEHLSDALRDNPAALSGA